MHVQQNNGLGHLFDGAARAYARFRPDYVPELFRDVFALRPLDGTSRALEIGAGTGQATGPVLATGCAVTALEPGGMLADLLREDFPGARLTVEKLRFEEFEAPPESFDLVYAATSFHWVPQEWGYRRVFELLKGGGVFARFANHPRTAPDDPELGEEIQALYGEFFGKRASAETTSEEEMAAGLARIALGYGFERTLWRLYHRTRVMSGEDYAGLLGTYSDHLALEPERREAFFSGIRRAIAGHGDRITIQDTIDLECAVKPA